MENKEQKPFDYEQAKQKVKEQFRSGKSLFSKGGAFAPLLQEMLNSMLEGEMDAHLDDEQRSVGNRRNGKSSKLLKTSAGTIEVDTPRDRLSSFDPEIVRKRETIMAQSLEDKITLPCTALALHFVTFRLISKRLTTPTSPPLH